MFREVLFGIQRILMDMRVVSRWGLASSRQLVTGQGENGLKYHLEQFRLGIR